MKTFLYKSGIENLANELTGTEKVHVGIRPYELHAGNILSIVAYPYLLCEAILARGIVPKFTFLVSINDWEQEELVGKNIYEYIFDTRPAHTTIKHGFTNTGVPTVDFWQPKIEQELVKIKNDFPNIKLKLIRNSSLKCEPIMRQVIRHTIEHRKQHKKMLLQISNRQTLGEDMYFANAICPQCDHANTSSRFNKDIITTTCQKCGFINNDNYDAYDYWLYHKQLFTARLAILKYDVAISGGDHYKEGDSVSREKMYEFILGQPAPNLKMLFAPVLLANNGTKMSKSRKNNKYIPLEQILPLARACNDAELQFA